MLDTAPLPPGVVAGFHHLSDLTGITSDAMDQLGITGAVRVRCCGPTDPKARIVGRALTVKNRKGGDATVAERVAA